MHFIRLTFIICFLPFCAFSQDTTTYIYQHSLGGTSIILLDNNKFIYRHASCTYSSYDKGIYEKSKRRLVLNFEDSKPLRDDSVTIEKFSTNKDSCEIEITVSRIFGEAIPFSMVRVYQNEKRIAVVKTDYDGFAKFKILKGNDPFEIEISSVGYEQTVIPFPNSLKGYKIKLLKNRKNSNISKFKKGDVTKYEILEDTNDYIILESKDGRTRYEKFIK